MARSSSSAHLDDVPGLGVLDRDVECLWCCRHGPPVKPVWMPERGVDPAGQGYLAVVEGHLSATVTIEQAHVELVTQLFEGGPQDARDVDLADAHLLGDL